MSSSRPGSGHFYLHVFLPEHRSPGNVALHVLGTVLGLAYVGAALLWGGAWFTLAFPVVHAVPGLVGHRLFERSATVGDVRITRKDHSLWWFILANHRMSWELLTKGFYWRSPSPHGL